MLGNTVRAVGDRFLGGISIRLARLGLTPGAARILELLSAAACGLALYDRRVVWGLAFLLIHGVFDYLDGALQRAGRPAPGGPERALRLHALTDKLAETAIFLGVGLGELAPLWASLLALFTAIGATLSGFYAHARGRGRREKCLFDRTDRVIILFISLAVGFAFEGLCAITVLNCVIVAQRLVGGGRRE